MGVGREPLWEVQWHSSRGGRVRRWLLTRAGVRRCGVAAAFALVALLAVLGLLPLGVHGLLAGFTLEVANVENRSLRRRGDELREEAARLAEQLHGEIQRARRLAWVVGARWESWQATVDEPPVFEPFDEVGLSWLGANSNRLAGLETALLDAAASPRHPLSALPTGPPIEPSLAVPVAVFGWHVSPFTGKEEAHHGATLAAPEGTIVRATGAGIVLFAGTVRERRSNEWTRFGTLVVIDSGGGGFVVFAHLREASVRRGQRVVRGERIGSVGTSGWTRVPALYLEIRWPQGTTSRPLDPSLFQLFLPLRDVDERLSRPDGGLPEDFARLERLPGHRG